MFDDYPVVSNYGKLSAQFHVGTSRLIEMVGFMTLFQFLARIIIKICLDFIVKELISLRGYSI